MKGDKILLYGASIVVLLTCFFVAMNALAYQYETMEVGDDMYVVCNKGHIQTDHTMPVPRPTPTNNPSPYPSPPVINDFQTSVYITCNGEEVGVLSIQQKTYMPIVDGGE